jgi:hypothetical protein
MTLCEQSGVPIQHIEADFRNNFQLDANLPFFHDTGIDPVFMRKLMLSWDIVNWNRENLYCGTRFANQQDLQVLADLEQKMKNMATVMESI